MKRKTIPYIAYIVLISTFFVSLTWSSYYSTFNQSVNVNVASFYINHSFSDSFISDLRSLSANNATYLYFDITNFNETTQSEVSLNYKIMIKTTGNLPLKFYIGENSDPHYISNQEFIFNEESGYFEAKGGVLPVDPTIHNYALEVALTSNDEKYKDEIDVIEFKIESNQKGE